MDLQKLWEKQIKNINSLTEEEAEIIKYLEWKNYYHIIGNDQEKQEIEKNVKNGNYKTEYINRINEIQKRQRMSLITKKLEDSQNFLMILKDVLGEMPIYYDKNKIWWIWNFNINSWEIVDETDILISIKNSLGINDINKNKKKNEILEALKIIGRENKPEEPNKNWIQFKNKIIDLNTKKEILPSPKYFFTNPILHNIGSNEETPIIDKLLTEWVGEEKELLYEIMAYCLYSDYPIHRIFCFTGTGCNGKSSYLELLRKFIGIDNVTGTELDILIDNRFESAKLYKKLVCMMGETNYNNLKNTSLLKRLTGQDLIGYEFKNKNPFDDYNYAKILIATNGIPITHDKSDGFYRRWIIIDFKNKFKEGNNILNDIPEKEFENLSFKCINKLINILKYGKFNNEKSIEEKAKIYEERSNPLIKFLKEKTTKDVDEFIYKYEFKEKFIAWQRQNGFRVWNDMEISSIMKEQFEEKQKGQQGYRAWLGIKWHFNIIKDDKLIENSQGSQGSQGFSTHFTYIENKLEKGVNPVNPVSFDFNILVWQPCKVCKETPCNLAFNNYYYCKKHFEQLNNIK